MDLNGNINITIKQMNKKDSSRKPRKVCHSPTIRAIPIVKSINRLDRIPFEIVQVGLSSVLWKLSVVLQGSFPRGQAPQIYLGSHGYQLANREDN